MNYKSRNRVDECLMEVEFEHDFSGELDFKQDEGGRKYLNPKTHMMYCIWRKGFMRAEKIYYKENT